MTSKSAAAIELTLYGRNACHLCEDMQQALQELQESIGFSFKWVDIDADPGLYERYNTQVPVLMHDDREICHYFLDPEALKSYFRQEA